MTAAASIAELITLTAQRELAYRSLAEFVKLMWREVEGSPLVWGPHMQAVCDELQAVWEESDRRRALKARIQAEEPDRDAAAARIEAEMGHLPPLRLVILVPPRSGKSTIVGKLAPVWRWLHRALDQILALSAVDNNVERDGTLLRQAVQSETFTGLMDYLVHTRRLSARIRLRDDTTAKKNFWTQYEDDGRRLGGRSGHTMGGRFVGVDADTVIIDDPHDIDDAFIGSPEQVAARMSIVRDSYTDKVQDRLNDKICGVIVLIMQRVHELDLAQLMIDRGASVVCLPAEYDPDHPYRYAKDWRTRPGESIDPIRWPEGLLQRMRAESPGPYAAKYGQRPTPTEGGLIKRQHLAQRWRAASIADLALEEIALSVDATFKDTKSSDLVAIQVWGRRGPRRYLLDQVLDRMNYPATKAAVKDVAAKWRPSFVLIEDKANGPALLADLRDEIQNLIAFDPGAKSKYERYQLGILPAAEAGNLYLPDAADAPWVLAYIAELCAVPLAAHDDQADATAQILLWWARASRFSDWFTDSVADSPAEEAAAPSRTGGGWFRQPRAASNHVRNARAASSSGTASRATASARRSKVNRIAPGSAGRSTPRRCASTSSSSVTPEMAAPTSITSSRFAGSRNSRRTASPASRSEIGAPSIMRVAVFPAGHGSGSSTSSSPPPASGLAHFDSQRLSSRDCRAQARTRFREALARPSSAASPPR